MADASTPEIRPYSSEELQALDAQGQFALQHALTYQPGLDAGAWPEHAVLPTGSHTPARWAHHPAGDADGQWATVRSHLDRGVYRTVSPMTGLEPRQKGTAKQVVSQPCIVFDIDTADGVHEPSRAGLPDPTREQGREILAALAGCGVKLTFVLDTGGGYQAVITLDRPFSLAKGEDGARPELPVKAAKALKAVCDSMGVAHDVKLTKGAAYPMRVAGGYNRKSKPAELTEKMLKSGWTQERLDSIPDGIYDRPVRLVAVTGETMTADELETALDAVTAEYKTAKPERTPGREKPSLSSGSGGDASGGDAGAGDAGEPSGYLHKCGGTDDPRDQVCLHLPMSRIVRELDRFAFEGDSSVTDQPDEDRKLTWTDNADNGISGELVWREHPETGVTRACVVPYGNSTSEMFGSGEQAPQCTFWYLRNAHCSGDTVLTYALTSHFADETGGSFDEDGLLGALEASETAREIRDAFPDIETAWRAAQKLSGPQKADPGQANPGKAAARDAPDLPGQFREAMDSFAGQLIRLGRNGEKDVFIIVGSDRHGTWISEEIWDARTRTPKEKVTQVWDAVAGTVDSVDYADGDTPEGEPLAKAFIIDRWGRTAQTPLMPVRDAYSPMKVWESLREAKVSCPEGPDCKRAVATSLKILDAGGSSESFQTAMGWHQAREDDGRDHWHYNGAVAGISHSGTIPGIWRKRPRVERAGGAVIVHQAYVSACQEATGWPDVPSTASGVREAAAWIGELRGLTPGRLDMHLALLGTYFAAPLAGMRKKPAISLEGEPESFKSGLVACYSPLLTGLPVDDENLTVSLKAKFSRPGIDGLRRTWNDAVVVLDDAADNSDAKRNADTAAVVDDAIKAAYGMADGAMADGAGGTDVRRSSRCAVIVTSEKPLEGLGVQSRALVLRLTKGDVVDDVSARLNPHIARGLPQRLYASYIRWLAQYLDANGEAGLRARIDAHKRALTRRLGNVRAVDVAGGVYAGLMMLAEFLEKAGCRHLLASQAEIDAVMELLTEEGKARNAEAGIGQVAVEYLEGMLNAGRGYLEGAAHLEDPSESAMPADSVAVDCGWRLDGENWRPKAGAIHLGYITDEDSDGKRWVLITKSGLQAAWRQSGRAEKYTQAIEAWKTGQSVPRFRGTARPSIGLPGAPKAGTVFDPATLGIRTVPVDEQARRLEDGTLPSAPADIVPPSGRDGSGGSPGATAAPGDDGPADGAHDGDSPDNSEHGSEDPGSASESRGALVPAPRDRAVAGDRPSGAGDALFAEPELAKSPAAAPGPGRAPSGAEEDRPPAGGPSGSQAQGKPGRRPRQDSAGETTPADPPAGPRADPDDGALFAESETVKKKETVKPWTRAQIEAAAKKVPRIWPDDLEEVGGIP